jgi:iron complex transport system ATP-binding protein
MERMGITSLADRPYTQLSGGQQQLVLIARALTQEPDLLIMDEPTASLDFGNQQLVLQQMRHLADEGTSVLMVTHDPDHALFCAHRVIVMEAGRIIAEGAPNEVLDTECLQRIYHTNVKVLDVELDGEMQRVCIPVLK